MRSGFTIIELIIALAVSVILGSIGVARYTSYLRQQEFVASGAVLVDCLQTAQQRALNNGGATPLRYTVATVAKNGVDLVCTVDGYSTTDAASSAAAISKAVGSGKLGTYPAANVTFAQGYVGSVYKLVYGTVERGQIVDSSADGIVSNWASFNTGVGFTLSLTYPTSGFPLKADITIGQTGTPVVLQTK